MILHLHPRRPALADAPRCSRPWAALFLVLSLALTGFTFVPATPESQGMSTAGLDALRVYSDSLFPDNGLLVMRFDKVVLESYIGGTTITQRREIKSTTKSFGASLLARAIDDGLLSLSDPACGEPGMTLGHLADFSGGLKRPGSSQCDDLLFPIGTDWAYSNGSANRVRDEVAGVYPGVALQDFIATEILDPIGATNFTWSGERFASGVIIDTRGLALYGRLWMRGGDWDGNQILPSALVSQFTTAANPTLKEDYGILWWVNSEGPAAPFNKYGFDLNPFFPTNAPLDAFMATGCQYDTILVVPSLQLVVARLGTNDPGGSCIDPFSGTPDFSDKIRQFVQLAMDAVLPCGNQQIDAGEQCDDGNLLDGDCCSSTCQLEVCDDGLFCDGEEICDVALGCQGGTPPVVDDGIVCTDDSCDEVLDVVVNTPNDGLCANGAFCDGSETCDALLDCQAGVPPVLDDGVVCTDDSCDEILDVVVNALNNGLCDNGAFCDGSETCDALLDCQAGVPPVLDDGVVCTDDSCDEILDVVVNAPNDASCANGFFCDGAEICDPVSDCQPGAPVNPGDGVACTFDVCDDSVDMVLNVPLDTHCNDGNACTAESCDAITGCFSTPIPGCTAQVPALSGAGRAILMAMLLAGAFLGPRLPRRVR